jgi:hypothetical protein
MVTVGAGVVVGVGVTAIGGTVVTIAVATGFFFATGTGGAVVVATAVFSGAGIGSSTGADSTTRVLAASAAWKAQTLVSASGIPNTLARNVRVSFFIPGVSATCVRHLS